MDRTDGRNRQEAPQEAGAFFDRLYRSSRDDVYAYVTGLLRDPAASEEVAPPPPPSSVLPQALALRPAPRRAASLAVRIARNAALDELRRRARQVELAAEPTDLDWAGTAAAGTSAEVSEQRLALGFALSRLSTLANGS